jgi:hypothetical protein
MLTRTTPRSYTTPRDVTHDTVDELRQAVAGFIKRYNSSC